MIYFSERWKRTEIFIKYFNLSEAEAMNLATDRATAFLREAAARLNLEVSNGINFLGLGFDQKENGTLF